MRYIYRWECDRNYILHQCNAGMNGFFYGVFCCCHRRRCLFSFLFLLSWRGGFHTLCGCLCIVFNEISCRKIEEQWKMEKNIERQTFRCTGGKTNFCLFCGFENELLSSPLMQTDMHLTVKNICLCKKIPWRINTATSAFVGGKSATMRCFFLLPKQNHLYIT